MSHHHDPQSYDGLAEHYEHLSRAHPDPVADWLPTVLPAAGSRALDLGCGGGRHAVLLAEQYNNVVAVDLSAAMIELAEDERPRPNLEYRVGDLFDVTGTFDLVFSTAMLHHVGDLDAALVHARGLVAPDGLAVLVDVIASGRLARLAAAVAPRLLYRVGAAVSLIGALIRRTPHAREHYRLKTHAPWLDHLATDRFLTADEFDARYAVVFDGATFVDLGYLRACVWQAPSTAR